MSPRQIDSAVLRGDLPVRRYGQDVHALMHNEQPRRSDGSVVKYRGTKSVSTGPAFDWLSTDPLSTNQIIGIYLQIALGSRIGFAGGHRPIRPPLAGDDDFSVAADGCCGGYRIDEMDKKPDAAGCVCAKECHSLNRRHHYQKVGGLAHNQELAVLCASPWRSVHHQSVVAGILVNSEKIMDEPEVPFAL
jgi:hypothetical protein